MDQYRLLLPSLPRFFRVPRRLFDLNRVPIQRSNAIGLENRVRS